MSTTLFPRVYLRNVTRAVEYREHVLRFQKQTRALSRYPNCTIRSAHGNFFFLVHLSIPSSKRAHPGRCSTRREYIKNILSLHKQVYYLCKLHLSLRKNIEKNKIKQRKILTLLMVSNFKQKKRMFPWRVCPI